MAFVEQSRHTCSDRLELVNICFNMTLIFLLLPIETVTKNGRERKLKNKLHNSSDTIISYYTEQTFKKNCVAGSFKINEILRN